MSRRTHALRIAVADDEQDMRMFYQELLPPWAIRSSLSRRTAASSSSSAVPPARTW
jgi:hypothetical protein